MEKLIVLEGLDGSGKATQTRLLEENLATNGYKVRRISFPNYESPSSALVRMYLDGAFGQNPGEVNPYAASAFYAVDRFAAFAANGGLHDKTGDVLLADRYATSNFIYQCAKLPPSRWEAFVQWLCDFEYGKMKIPKPDAVIYLDVEPAISQALLLRRYAGDENKKDIHENDLAYLLRCREAAQWCAQQQGWKWISCSAKEEMRPEVEIAQEVFRTVKEAL